MYKRQTFNLADRANLYFKVGNFVDITFDSEEQVLIQKIADVETFDDVLKVAEELYLFCKKEKEEKVDDTEMPPNMGGESDQPANELEEQQESSGEGSGESMTHEEMLEEAERREAGAALNDEPEVHTADALESNLQDLVEESGYENVYVEIPKVDLKYIIAKNDDIHKEMDAWFNHQENRLECLFDKVDGEFLKFKRNAQKEVNYLVKEFECRKAADSYARATTARTGVLDTSKLHTYKYNEDLFKKVSVIPDGKNHGLIFILDWSGSMSRVMLDTIKQLYNLIWFCKKVSIPFEVYAFTNEWKKPEINYETQELVKPADWTSSYEKKSSSFSSW